MKSTTILIDTNILLDHFDDREPYRENAVKILELCANGVCNGFIAAHSITNIFYILRKKFSPEDRKKILLSVCEILEVSGLDQSRLLEALQNNTIIDLEDCLQMNCAKAVGAEYIITRDLGDFIQSPVPAISPADFLKKIFS
jgi:predicted nucleic acid-binding protein